jgi:hypothetical protein
MQSRAATVEQYLAELPEDRRAAISAVRQVILRNLDKDYEEGMQYGAIGYFVPHRIYPAGYHCDPRQPLPFAGLSSQQNYMSIGFCMYGDMAQERWLREEWAKTGKRLDMGRCCIRFRKLDDLPLEVIAEAVRRVPAKEYIARYERLLGAMKEQAAARKAAAGKGPAGKTKEAARKAPGKSTRRGAHARAR